MAADREHARRQARELLERREIVRPATPIERLVKMEGAVLQYVPLDDELSGMAFVKGGQPIIVVNALHPPNRQRFTTAHELGHITLHLDYISSGVHVDKEFRVSPETVLKRDVLASSGRDWREIEANAFASELLMPRDWVLAEIQGGLDIDDDEKLAMLARRFKVSQAAMQFRLMDLL